MALGPEQRLLTATPECYLPKILLAEQPLHAELRATGHLQLPEGGKEGRNEERKEGRNKEQGHMFR